MKRLVPGATYRAAAQAVSVPMPKQGRNVTDKPLRDVALLQWVADFIAELFELDPINVTGGKAEKKQVVSVVEVSQPRRQLRTRRVADDRDYEDKREARRRKYRLR